jgi:hypothetical protein
VFTYTLPAQVRGRDNLHPDSYLAPHLLCMELIVVIWERLGELLFESSKFLQRIGYSFLTFFPVLCGGGRNCNFFGARNWKNPIFFNCERNKFALINSKRLYPHPLLWCVAIPQSSQELSSNSIVWLQ